ncbi:MAG TPA: formate/nitrite transporter family protein [Thermoanaerobaculia bacterium]|nr:formate/nitrite transporter family protein [Thermoanaerobaculia bacterium]
MQEREHRDAEERSSPTAATVHHAICKEGESELERTTSALAWSGLAAGLSMGFAFLGTALLHGHLPHAKWTPLVTAFGYTLGFVIVVLGRQQLFTENTLTVVLPLLSRKEGSILWNVVRLWVVVLAANLIGAILIALVFARTEVVDHETYKAMREIAHHAQAPGFAVTLLRGIIAGWLIALMVWLLPFAETARVLVIVLIAWLVQAGHFSHIIAGSVDGAFLVFIGESTWGEFFLDFFTPTLIGNVIGGVSLVAAINHAQVKTDA